MNVRLERADDKGGWHDEGHMGLVAFMDSKGIDPYTRSLMLCMLATIGIFYEGRDRRLTRIDEGTQL